MFVNTVVFRLRKIKSDIVYNVSGIIIITGLYLFRSSGLFLKKLQKIYAINELVGNSD